MLVASAAWFLRPAPTHSARLLRAMLAPGHPPREELVNWMTLVARHVRSSGVSSLAFCVSIKPGAIHLGLNLLQ